MNTTPEGTGNGAGGQGTSVPYLTITFDPRTFLIGIGGSVPNWEFAEAILHMAIKETERKINERRVRTGIAVAGPELFTVLTRRGPQ